MVIKKVRRAKKQRFTGSSKLTKSKPKKPLTKEQVIEKEFGSKITDEHETAMSRGIEYELENGESYMVFDSYEDAENEAIERVEENLDDDPETYLGDWAMNFIDEEKARDRFKYIYDEMNSSYAYDIKDESSDEYTNRLAEEMVERDIISEKEGKDKEFDLEYKIQDLVDDMTKDQLDEGREGYDNYEFNFGEEEAKRLLIRENLIDIRKASEYAIRTDGVAHELSRYDGEEIELSDGRYAYRTN